MTDLDAKRVQFDQYIGSLFVDEDDVLRWIMQESRQQELPKISIQPYEGYLISWLVRLIGARRAVEIGTLAGYSGTWIARSLPSDGKLFTLEIEEKHANIAQESFERAGVNDKVEILLGDAMERLRQLEPEGPFDFIFIDAEKSRYPAYLQWAVDHLRPGGLVTAHNTFRHGGVLDPQNDGDAAVDAFNRSLSTFGGLDPIIIPMGDGLSVARRR